MSCSAICAFPGGTEDSSACSSSFAQGEPTPKIKSPATASGKMAWPCECRFRLVAAVRAPVGPSAASLRDSGAFAPATRALAQHTTDSRVSMQSSSVALITLRRLHSASSAGLLQKLQVVGGDPYLGDPPGVDAVEGENRAP